MRTSNSSNGLLWKILRFFQLDKVYRLINRLLPSSVVNSVSEIRLKNIEDPLVIVEDLNPKYEMAWKHLTKPSGRPWRLPQIWSFARNLNGVHAPSSYETKSTNVRMFGFDWFEAMPDTSAVEDKGRLDTGAICQHSTTH